jgi:hypothetical protein
MRRDPRMVERKKTGLAKARKRVRISTFLFTLMVLSSNVSSTPGSNDNIPVLRYIDIIYFFLSRMISQKNMATVDP